jgi:murein L,D-transpeptidase YcbB/YkuD
MIAPTLLSVLLASSAAAPPGDSLTELVRERLRNRLEAVPEPDDLRARGERVHASLALPMFYARRVYLPGWLDDGMPGDAADALVAALRAAEREGLTPLDYHLAVLERTIREVRDGARSQPADTRRLADLDLLLTDAFMIYGSHLLQGRVNPETIDPEWFANRRGADFAEVLETALREGTIRETLEELAPPQVGYERLRDALVRYRRLVVAGGWAPIPAGPVIAAGDTDPRVPALRARLAATGDLALPTTSGNDGPEQVDTVLAVALEQFQARHGLEADARLTEATRTALNVPADVRMRQLELNLERWRWLPQDLGPRHILVNIAAFELDVVEEGSTAMSMRVMVGRPYRRTPVFTGLMTHLVLSPFWHVPRNIAVQDKLPEMRRDPSLLARQRIRVFRGWGAEIEEIDPAAVEWSAVTAANFDFRLRQDPGPQNALGRAKFMFPNRFNVYLHDTPTRELFARAQRDFSSGCIRVERPLDLAEYLLREDPQWTRPVIERVVSEARERTVPLPAPVPVHLLYWTAWADEDGTIQFRDDLYGRDRRLAPALTSPPPTEDR